MAVRPLTIGAFSEQSFQPPFDLRVLLASTLNAASVMEARDVTSSFGQDLSALALNTNSKRPRVAINFRNTSVCRDVS